MSEKLVYVLMKDGKVFGVVSIPSVAEAWVSWRVGTFYVEAALDEIPVTNLDAGLTPVFSLNVHRSVGESSSNSND